MDLLQSSCLIGRDEPSRARTIELNDVFGWRYQTLCSNEMCLGSLKLYKNNLVSAWSDFIIVILSMRQKQSVLNAQPDTNQVHASQVHQEGYKQYTLIPCARVWKNVNFSCLQVLFVLHTRFLLSQSYFAVITSALPTFKTGGVEIHLPLEAILHHHSRTRTPSLYQKLQRPMTCKDSPSIWVYVNLQRLTSPWWTCSRNSRRSL